MITSRLTSPISAVFWIWKRSAARVCGSALIRLAARGVDYWPRIIEHYKIAATIVNDAVDPTFRFMTLDWDGKIRMDCSSAYAMEPLLALRKKFDIAFANDTDADRHGIVCPSTGLMNPNHFLTASIAYLFAERKKLACGQCHRQDDCQQCDD